MSIKALLAGEIATPVDPPVSEYILQTDGPSSFSKFMTISGKERLITLNGNSINTWDPAATSSVC